MCIIALYTQSYKGQEEYLPHLQEDQFSEFPQSSILSSNHFLKKAHCWGLS